MYMQRDRKPVPAGLSTNPCICECIVVHGRIMLPPHDAPLKSSLLDKPQRGFPVGSREAGVRVLSRLFLLIRGVEVKRKMKERRQEKPTNADFVKKQRSAVCGWIYQPVSHMSP